jgi:hypothetical protein
MKRSSFVVGLLVVALMVSGVPVWAQEESAAPLASAPASEVPFDPDDLYLDMPYYLGGFEPDIVMTRGQEHFANLDANDQTRLELEGFLESVGADIDDMVSGYALVSQEDFFAFVVGLRVAGAVPGSLMPAYLPILYEDLEEPSSLAGNAGGRNVVVITSIGSADEFAELYVYDAGDTLWLLQGPVSVVEDTLENLPDPLPEE